MIKIAYVFVIVIVILYTDRVPGRGVRSDQEVIDSGKAWEPISLRPQAG
jgi:hypothetical protein